jgi:membrane protease YdiL (CAAX protease family)
MGAAMDYLYASLLSSSLSAGFVLLLALPALFGPNRRWLLLAPVLAFIDEFSTTFPGYRTSPLHIIAGQWNWEGKIVNLVVLVAIAVFFIARGTFTRQDLGLTLRQRPGTGRAVLLVVIPFLLLIAAVAFATASHEVPAAEAIAFQATLPGLGEELFFRGLLLAVFDRLFPPARTIWNARIGYGVVATSLAFAFVHVCNVHRAPLAIDWEFAAGISPLVGAFIGAWVRARTGSLVVPVLAHNAGNLISTFVPMVVR